MGLLNGGTVKYCAILPTYNHVHNLAELCQRLLLHVEQVFVVDDGSTEPVAGQIQTLNGERITVLVRSQNGGKGAAVKFGLAHAIRCGFTHAVQMDADGQHDVAAVTELLSVSAKEPDALVLGAPQFDATAPKLRRWARNLTTFWTRIEAGVPIVDPMCGFRLYPLGAVGQVHTPADRMDFDPEIIVRLVWLGTPIRYVPVNVRYAGTQRSTTEAHMVPNEPSRFLPFRDNLLIAWMHTRLMFEKFYRPFFGRQVERLPKPAAPDHE